jgi:hypothetical protein
VSKIVNGFIDNPNIIVEWCHSEMSSCYRIPSPIGEPMQDPPEIGDDEGYLTLQAIDMSDSANPKPMESSIIMHPFYQNGHKVTLSYNLNGNDFKWKIMATVRKKKGKGFKQSMQLIRDKIIWLTICILQIDVNVEIGPK